MAITSVGYDGTVDEKQFRQIMGFSASSEYGVDEPGAFAASSVAGQVLQVRLDAGKAWTAGVVDTMDASDTVQLEPTTSVRWDMIVLRRDYQPPGGTTTLRVIKGGGSMKLPTRQNNPGVLDDQPLWLVKLEKEKSVPSQYVDLRVWARNSGCTANHDLVRSYLNGTGTEVEINGIVWLLRNGANNQAEWVKPIELASTYESIEDTLVRRSKTGSSSFKNVWLDGPQSTAPDAATRRDFVEKSRMGGSIASGTVTVNPTREVTEGGDTYYRGTNWVPFPEGRFTRAPHVTVSENTEVPGRVLGVAAVEASTTGFRAWVARKNTTGVNLTWVAVQTTA